MKKIIFLSILIFAGCASGKFKVQSTIVKDTDYSQFDSFKYFNPNNLPKSNFTFNEAHQKLIFDLIAAELKDKGFTSHQQADLIIKVQGGTENVEESDVDYNTSYPYYGRYYYNTYDYNNYRDRSEKFTTIIVDVIDAKTNKLLWQGVAYGALAKKKEDQEEKIKNAIKQIFQNFPVGQTNSAG